MLTRRVFVQGMIQLPLLGLLGGCGHSDDHKPSLLKPVAIHSGDECAVCGMLIERFAGPKGEAIRAGHPALKFCSTRELVGWWLQPENQHQPFSLYVHDMGHTNWDHPADSAFTDARKAWYVMGSDRTGAMGPTLGSFAQKTDANGFATAHGGKVMAFNDLNLNVMESLLRGHAMPGMSHPMG